MPTLKPTKLATGTLLALLGAGYFSLFAEFELPYALRNYAILMPVQIGLLIYFLSWRRSRV